jgi:hypothetical protein
MIACVDLPPSLAGQWPMEAIDQWRPLTNGGQQMMLPIMRQSAMIAN